ncbi:Ig-like domain-containing protein [Listeria valentina]|uniref:Ig-like domain-containing protein n=1 Tax=Listeria valentina TaxID=2705293 RepID=UPI001FE4CF0A|nr:Ig-like domain-containing protein [Listeria valentina]
MRNPAPEPSSVTVDSVTKSVEVGSTVNITATVEPPEADQSITFSSSDEAVATVTAAGVVTGVAAGTATITVTSKEKSTVKADVTITVTGSK